MKSGSYMQSLNKLKIDIMKKKNPDKETFLSS